jgi:SAM-dependent methyltransferase
VSEQLPSPKIDSIHRVSRNTRAVDRVERLLELCRGRRVIDLGFVDEGRMELRHAEGSWLHARLRSVASEIVGLDANRPGVDRARELGFDVRCVDCTDPEEVASLDLEPADVVVAGELIEHLDAPGRFLEAVKPLVADGGLLVLTTPNGLSLTNFLAGTMRREFVNVDHVAWYSNRTLTTLFERHGWSLERLDYYFFPQVAGTEADVARGTPLRARVFDAYQAAARPLFRLLPNLADGLLATARRSHG